MLRTEGWMEGGPTEDGRRAGISRERDGEESLLKQKEMASCDKVWL